MMYKLLIIIILGLSITLRLTGLQWGIGTNVIPHIPFHPDEHWAVDVLKEINIDSRDFNPEQAHREGTLAYYIWTISFIIAKKLGIIAKMPFNLTDYGNDYFNILYLGRIVTVFFDLFSVLFIFMILKKIVKKNIGLPLLGAFIFSIIPFEVIHAHYMRTHIISNFFALAVIHTSLFIYHSKRITLFILIGFLCGLATATKYTTGIIIIIPLSMLLYKFFKYRTMNHPYLFMNIMNDLGYKTFLIFVFLFIGFFISDPLLFLDFQSAKPHILVQSSYAATEEFSIKMLLDMTRINTYISHLIPYGTLPFLWALFYFSFVYTLFIKKYYQYTLPLIVCALLYLYFMAKGYASPMFIRATLFLFPIFTIITAIAIGNIWEWAQKRRVTMVFTIILISIILIPTFMYDCAYINGMAMDDPRIQLYKYFSKNVSQKEIKIGIYASGWDYFLFNPTLNIIPNKSIEYIDLSSYDANSIHNANIDYILLYAFEAWQFKQTHERIQNLMASKEYIFEKKFSSPISFLGINFDYDNMPHDLRYPFPELFLLKLPTK